MQDEHLSTRSSSSSSSSTRSSTMITHSVLLLAALGLSAALGSELAGPVRLAGIVVPKRSALISGLDQQFKRAANQTSSFSWLGSRANSQQTKKPLVAPMPASLLLDRHQQEILAANPNLLNPSSLPNSALLTRSDVTGQQAESQAGGRAASSPSAGPDVSAGPASAAGATNQPGQQQSYRGYSLIELEVRSDSDRRYIQDLYGNLSLVIDEQAANPNALTVSPYVDVDFWSFKLNALNDQIDIMVSPKSRAFMLGQLSRAKIRHRIKIDDIQARLDQQPGPAASAQPAPASSKSADDGLSGRQGSGADSPIKGRQAPAESGQQASGSSKPLNDSQFFDNFQRLAEINQYIESIVERNRDVANVKVIGRSSQGRYLRVLKLGYDQQDVDGSTGSLPVLGETELEQAGRRQAASMNNASYILNAFFRQQQSVQKLGSIWLDGGTHAREWISPSTVLYIAFRLSENHNRCLRFFDTLREIVSVAHTADRSARNYMGSSPPNVAHLDAELIHGINEINTSLLGKPAKQARPRTELEHTLELLAKSPQEVASEYGCDLEIEQLLRRYTFFIMPVLNPDGYEYSHTHNRLWRKTRSTSSHPIYRHFCLGADPNRNYDARHGSTGSSTHPCSQTYAGSVPFTEPETRHQSNFVYANRVGMKMFISFHSYSQMILLPFSHSKQLAPDHKDLDSVGQAAVKAIERTHGTVYRVGPSASILYTASGTASDWAYEKAGIKYSYTIELRDTGTYGFLLPKNQITPTGEETFNGLLAMISQMEKNDNLLTSKSHIISSIAMLQDNSTRPGEPDRPQLSSPTKHKPRASLENIIDGSDTWAAPDSGPTGVRDRLPLPGLKSTSEAPVEFFDPVANLSLIRLDEEPAGDDTEPDSGYAFEGEGELLEPTRDNILEASKQVSLKLSGRRDHTRRIAQVAGLTASGRNTINSPLLATRTTPGPTHRESSEDLVKPSKNKSRHL